MWYTALLLSCLTLFWSPLGDPAFFALNPLAESKGKPPEILMRVSVRPAGKRDKPYSLGRFVMAPADVQITVILTPHDHNDWLTVTAWGDLQYRSSSVQLHGKQSPSLHIFEWVNMPISHYDIWAVASYRTRARATTRATLDVIGPGAEIP